MAATYRYDPYGNTVSSSGTQASANVYRFSSKEVHANSGMYMYLYRFYDPSLQRWLTRDPVGSEGSTIDAISYADPIGPNTFFGLVGEQAIGPNLYSYLDNCPDNAWDGWGLSKGGKQNIACEGFTKKSNSADVEKAMKEAKAANQLKRYRVLRGLFKVIKRGGAQIGLFFEFFEWEIENDPELSGGAPGWT